MSTRQMGNAARNQPQAPPSGQHVQALFHISASLSLSAGDAWVVGKLPHGAIPIGAVFYPSAQIVAKFGTSASLSLFLGSATYSIAGSSLTAKRLGTFAQISLSDDVILRYEQVIMTASGGVSLGFVGDLIVSYLMPGASQ